MKMDLKVKGMHCNSCKILVEEALQDLGAKDIRVSVDAGKQVGSVSCDYGDLKKVVQAITSEGYTVI